jgi:hypothetical protein
MCVVHAENLKSSSSEIHFTIVSAVGVSFHVKENLKSNWKFISLLLLLYAVIVVYANI